MADNFAEAAAAQRRATEQLDDVRRQKREAALLPSRSDAFDERTKRIVREQYPGGDSTRK